MANNNNSDPDPIAVILVLNLTNNATPNNTSKAVATAPNMGIATGGAHGIKVAV